MARERSREEITEAQIERAWISYRKAVFSRDEAEKTERRKAYEAQLQNALNHARKLALEIRRLTEAGG